MANTPMVIFWSNSDGSVTVSQRQASGEVMPTVVASPPRVATPLPSLTSLSGTTPKFGYSIPVRALDRNPSATYLMMVRAGQLRYEADRHLGVWHDESWILRSRCTPHTACSGKLWNTLPRSHQSTIFGLFGRGPCSFRVGLGKFRLC